MKRASLGVALPFLFCPFSASAAPPGPSPAEAPRVPVLVELFTSEGCSSCPPADAALEQLEERQPVSNAQIIALGFHVDYWNQLGWADPYSSPQSTARQESYGRAFRLNGVYTPQVVIDGQTQLVGGSAGVSEKIAAAARGSRARIQISLGPTSASSLSVRVRIMEPPAISSNDEAELWLALTEGNLQSNVLRGENAGRKLRHTAVVRSLKPMAKLSPGAKELSADSNESLDASWARANLKAVAFLQERRSRRVLGAAAIPLDAH